MESTTFDISNILVIGCGGAGLRAAIEAKISGLNVKVLGKRARSDSHTVLAAGGINAPFGNVDPEDSWQQHFIDTYMEGYGLGDPEQIEILAKESISAVEEIDEWGADFAKLDNHKLDQRFFGAHTYRRTCYSGDYTGQSIMKALLQKSKTLKIPIFDSQYVTDLLIKDNCCFGAMSFNMSKGERTIHLADAVVLCTGGHTRIWKRSSSRKQENTGDGYYLALKSGCTLIDMEMVQFHPTGMLLPEDIAGTLVTEAVRGEGGILLNGKGERFMVNYDKERMELSTRDRIAIANYKEIIEGRSTPNGGVYLDISHRGKDFIIDKIPKIYRQFIESQMLDISKAPMEVAPTAHYSMGGIFVKAKDHSTNVRGLYAAGEVAGGLHGANRLGGNSLAEILVFGKIAGKAATKYSKSLNFQIRSPEVIKSAHENIDRLIKKGEELVIPIQKELTEIMWKSCGVVRNKNKLKKGLENIKELKERFKLIDVRIEDKNFQDLINSFDLEASIYTAESTIISSLNRCESRGSHQRDDYEKIKCSEELNYLITMDSNKELYINSKELTKLNISLKEIAKKYVKINTFEDKLLE